MCTYKMDGTAIGREFSGGKNREVTGREYNKIPRRGKAQRGPFLDLGGSICAIIIGRGTTRTGKLVQRGKETGQAGGFGDFSFIPIVPVFLGEILMVIGIKHLPERGAEDTASMEDGEAERVGVNDLVGSFVNTDFTANTANDNKVRDKGFFDYIKILSETAEGYVHILMRLREHVYGHAIMAMEFKPVDSSFRERLVLTGIELNTGLIDNELTVFHHIDADIVSGINTVAAVNRDIGPYIHAALPVFTVQNPVGEAVGPAATGFNDDAFFLGLFGKIGSKGGFTGAGDAEIDIEHERVLGVIGILESVIQQDENKEVPTMILCGGCCTWHPRGS